DPVWFVKPLIDDTSNRLIGIFWMSPKQCERWANRLAAQAFIQDERQESYEWLLQCCLESCKIAPLTFVTDADPAMIAAISTDFKNIQCSHCEEHTWVKCFTSRSFTAGTQSTQRAKSENALIKKVVQSSFSLLEVQEALENRLEFEFINNHYSIWKASTLQYTQPFVVQTFFNSISLIISKYLTQPINDAHYKQKCQSVCYHAYKVPISEISLSDDDLFEPF
ncbi:8794_t:CDS:2, partial [Gigaspora rosea]